MFSIVRYAPELVFAPERRGERWLVNGRYYRFAINTGVVAFDDSTDFLRHVAAHEAWAELEPSRSRRQKRYRGEQIMVSHESDWSLTRDEETIQLWWYFMNEHDALLFKLRWC
jgi:hypothetical protein